MYKYSNSISFGGFEEINNFSETELNNWIIINCSNQKRDDSDVWVPLNDGIYDGGNTQTEFSKAVNSIRNKIQSDENVFVHCAMGQSRSVSILATAITAESENEIFEDVLEKLMTIRGINSEPSPSLQSKAKIYLRHLR